MTYLDALASKIRINVSAGIGIPDDSDDLFLLYALVARVKGLQVNTRDVHDAWVAWMQARGENHASMVPFEELDAAIRREDEPFVDAIRRSLEEMKQ